MFSQQLINGLTIGMIYALIALGYTMVYGILKFVNFAHGDIYMFGSFIGLVLLEKFNASLITGVCCFCSSDCNAWGDYRAGRLSTIAYGRSDRAAHQCPRRFYFFKQFGSKVVGNRNTHVPDFLWQQDLYVW